MMRVLLASDAYPLESVLNSMEESGQEMRESPSNSPREHYSIRFSTDREQDGQIVVFRKTEGVEIRKKKKK